MSLGNNKLVLFGAGRIGRSFISQLFSRGGFEVVFVDINKPMIDELKDQELYMEAEKIENFLETVGIHEKLRS